MMNADVVPGSRSTSLAARSLRSVNAWTSARRISQRPPSAGRSAASRPGVPTELERRLEHRFGLREVSCRHLKTPVNDVFAVATSTGMFALKLYHANRTAADVQWEIDLVRHIADDGAPVALPVAARGEHLHRFSTTAGRRLGVLFEWAPGEKPAPARDTYLLLGRAAALTHRAADTFRTSLAREVYDETALIDEQLARMRPQLALVGRWQQAVDLGERLKRAIDDSELDRGVCHMDLTLDNVHRLDDELTVFDFDSAGECWRAIEPGAVLRLSKVYFDAWLEGYREVRRFGASDERAAHAFAFIGDLRGVAWQLGVAESSRGQPLLETADLAEVVDGWLAWEMAGD
jgi:Ser/Thr protein kinase RdoA (MazF antagonist)